MDLRDRKVPVALANGLLIEVLDGIIDHFSVDIFHILFNKLSFYGWTQSLSESLQTVPEGHWEHGSPT